MALVGTPLLLISLVVILQVAAQDSVTGPPEEIIIDGPSEGNEGDDILYLPGQLEDENGERKATSYTFYYWEEDSSGFPQVPYTFTDSLVNQTAVELAIAHWEETTCLKFPRVEPSETGPHIHFQRHSSACNSYIGNVFDDGQPINVSPWCEESFGSLVHEIGHAIGFYHEQSRSDRDSYVTINTDNINPNTINNFKRSPDNNFSIPYDYNSDMHYGERAFQINGKITIATLNPLYQGVIGYRGGLSHMDRLLANRMYSCIDKYLITCGLNSDPCQNHGYIWSNCSCICPEGTSGTNCETLVTPYTDIRLSAYTETVTTEGPLTSPLYPSTTPIGEKYTKWIKAPACKLVQVTFSDFATIEREEVNGVSICYFEGLEIRTDNMYDGAWYCGSEISSGQTFESVSNQMILFFKTNGGNYSPAKWSATVSFISTSACVVADETTTTSTPPTSTTTTTKMNNESTTTSTPPTSSTTTPKSTTTTTPKSTTTTTTTTPIPTSTTTTTPIPTSTTTTTVFTTTTTARPTTTTPMEPSNPQCSAYTYYNGLKAFRSPNYPYRYPNNYICQHQNTDQVTPRVALILFTRFRLARGDKLVIEHPYGRPYILRGVRRRRWIKKVPGFFKATFISDGAYNDKGFFARYYQLGSRCHRTIDTSRPGIVTSPGFPFRHPRNTLCEWKFTARPGRRILLYIRMRRVPCRTNYLAIDKTPYDTPEYDSRAIRSYCGRFKSFRVWSTSNTMSVFYNGYNRANGVWIVYRQIY